VAWLSPAEQRKITDVVESFRSATLSAANWEVVYEQLVQLRTGLVTADRTVVNTARLELFALSPARGFSISDATTAPSGVVELLNNIEGSLQAGPSPDSQSGSQRDEHPDAADS
jgi:hypothetical protein